MLRSSQTGGVVVVANHISNADPLALGQFLAYSGRWPRFLAKASLFKVPVVGGILRACGQLPVERNSTRSGEGLAAAVEAVEQGRAVVIYPEGTISKDPDLWPMVGRTGAARVALRTGCPVIPVGQWGAQELLYGDRLGFPKILPRKTLRMLVGDPVPLDDLRALPLTAAVLDEATTRMMDALVALVAQLRGGRAARRAPQPPGTADRGRSLTAARVAVMGAGSWGTAFAMVLSDAGNDVTLWARRPELATKINTEHRNPDYFPTIGLPESLTAVSDPERAMAGADFVVLAVIRRSRCARTWRAGRFPGSAVVVSLAKGIELGTGLRMSQLIAEAGRHRRRPDRRGHRSEPGAGDRRTVSRRPAWWPVVAGDR